MKKDEEDKLNREDDPIKSRKMKDQGDPRGSRQPETKTRRTDVEEKGDRNRPFHRKDKHK